MNNVGVCRFDHDSLRILLFDFIWDVDLRCPASIACLRKA